MSYLYLCENGATVGIEENYVVVSYSNEMKKKIPIETLESIQIFGHASITSPCIVQCLKKGIPVMYYSKGGAYFGRLQSTGHVNAVRQRMQSRLGDTPFALELSRRLIEAKIHNQRVVLRRYERSKEIEANEEIKMLHILERKVQTAKGLEELRGYEGNAAKVYFRGLGKLVEPEFAFHGRSRRPPRDEFNSMLSLGYSLLMNEIYGKIEGKGLNPYFGFLHADKEQHPTLASDLMEEWRAVIVDSMVMSLVNGHEMRKEHFSHSEEAPGIYLTRDGMKIFLKKYDLKVRTKVRYLEEVDYAVSFRRGMDLQMNGLVRAIEQEDPNLYTPIKIR